MGASVVPRVAVSDRVELAATEAVVAAEPGSAVVYVGIGFLNAFRKLGVPKVSVNAMLRTWTGQPPER